MFFAKILVFVTSDLQSSSSSSFPKHSPFSGLDDALMSYLFGKKRATDIAHMIGAKG
ncbi:hypothetical protein glysoja_011460 [Glycine soja]|nr:hypothetical protein glysoja_011460 [Glycine soja]